MEEYLNILCVDGLCEWLKAWVVNIIVFFTYCGLSVKPYWYTSRMCSWSLLLRICLNAKNIYCLDDQIWY